MSLKQIMDEQPITVDLLRHGEPEGGSKYRGQLDDPLSELGWKQMRQSISNHQPWSAVVSSPLSRCALFAKETSDQLALKLTFEPRFKEISFGDWEGFTAKELLETEPKKLQNYWDNPFKNPPPNGETLADFQLRIITAWDELIERHRGQHILLIGHAGMMRIILLNVLQMPLEHLFRLEIPHAGIARVQIDGKRGQTFPRLKFFSKLP